MIVAPLDRLLTMAELAAVPVVPPREAGRVWKGVRHVDFVSELLNALAAWGWPVKAPAMLLTSAAGADLTGYFRLSPVMSSGMKDVDVCLGFQQSNAMRSRARLFVGGVTKAGVNFVYDDVPLPKIHTKDANVPACMRSAVAVAADQFRLMSKWFERMIFCNFSTNATNAMILEAGRTRAMPWSRIGRVDKAYTEGRAAHGSTGLILYQAFADVVKMNPPERQPGQLLTFARLVIKAADGPWVA